MLRRKKCFTYWNTRNAGLGCTFTIRAAANWRIVTIWWDAVSDNSPLAAVRCTYVEWIGTGCVDGTDTTIRAPQINFRVHLIVSLAQTASFLTLCQVVGMIAAWNWLGTISATSRKCQVSHGDWFIDCYKCKWNRRDAIGASQFSCIVESAGFLAQWIVFIITLKVTESTKLSQNNIFVATKEQIMLDKKI